MRLIRSKFGGVLYICNLFIYESGKSDLYSLFTVKRIGYFPRGSSDNGGVGFQEFGIDNLLIWSSMLTRQNVAR